MVDSLETYLARLNRRLTKRLPKEIAEEHLRELSGHLHENVVTRMASGQTEAIAQREALKDLGSDYLVADGLIRAHSGIAKRSVWRLAWLSSSILILAAALPLTFVFLGIIPPILQDIAMWLPTCFLTAFGYTCWRSRRTLITPIVTSLAIIFVLIALQAWATSPTSGLAMAKINRDIAIKQQTENVTMLRAEVQLLNFADKGGLYPEVLRRDGAYLAPGPITETQILRGPFLPITKTVSFPGILLITIDSEKEARNMWEHLDSAHADRIRMNLRSSEASLHYWQNPSAQRDSVKPVLTAISKNLAPVVLVLLAFNLLILGIGNAQRRIVTMLWQRRLA